MLERISCIIGGQAAKVSGMLGQHDAAVREAITTRYHRQAVRIRSQTFCSWS